VNQHLRAEDFSLPYTFDHFLAANRYKRLVARVTLESDGRDHTIFLVFKHGRDAGSATHLHDAIVIYNEA
jgi:hypothetical protein